MCGCVCMCACVWVCVHVCVCVCVCVASSEALPIPVVCLQYNKILASFPGLHPGVRRPGNEANRISLLDLIIILMAYIM